MDSAREPIRINSDFFIKKCRHDLHKLNFNRNTKLSNLSREEWTALINLKNRNGLVIKAADKGGAILSPLAHRPLPTRSNSATFGHRFLHQSQQRPNFRQPKNCQRNHSGTHNQTRTISHRPKSHLQYS